MRSHLLLLGFVAACGDGKTAKHFCHSVRLVFHEMAVVRLGEARDGLGPAGHCSDVNKASAQLSTMLITFSAAAVAFRERSEVAATLDALDKLTLDEVNQIGCSWLDQPTAQQVTALRARIDHVETKLADIAAACSAQ